MLSATDIHTAPAPATGWLTVSRGMSVFARKTGNGGLLALASRCVA
jgi:hypothetical protein